MVQIDVKEILDKNTVLCNLYTGERCVQIIMPHYEYENLIRDGFFIRDGKERDSANVLNTTEVYQIVKPHNRGNSTDRPMEDYAQF